MTARGEAPADRTLNDVLLDLDDWLVQIRHAADLVITTAGGATIEPTLYDRLTFCAKTIEAFAHKAEVCSNEAFDISRKVSSELRGDAA